MFTIRQYKYGKGCYPNAAAQVNSYRMDYCYTENWVKNSVTTYFSYFFDSNGMFEYDYYDNAVCNEAASSTFDKSQFTTDCMDLTPGYYDYLRYFSVVFHTSKF